MREPTLQDLAKRVDELDGMVRGLIGYLALQTPELDVDQSDPRFSEVMRQVSRPESSRMVAAGSFAGRGHWEVLAIQMIDEARKLASTLSIPAPDWRTPGGGKRDG
jgi:hypothetical protein